MLNLTKLCQWAKTNVPGTTIRLDRRGGSVFMDIEVVQNSCVAHSSFDLCDGRMLTDAEVREHILATASEVE